MTTLYLCGAGNPEGVRLALTINRAESRWDRIVILDDDSSKHGRSILGVEVIGSFDLLRQADSAHDEVASLVARTTTGREAARRKIAQYGLPFASLVGPGVDTTGAELARGVTVYEDATIGPEVTVGEGSVVFMGARVGHESRVGRGCVVAANSVLNARVVLEDGVYVGTNATVLPEVTVGRGATIGAGSVAFQDVPAGATVIGVPAEILMTRDEKHAVEFVEARTPIEQSLREICREVLGKERIGVDDSFVELGGTSLSFMNIATRIQQVFQIEIGLRTLFEQPTVAEIAAVIEEKMLDSADDNALSEALQEIEGLSADEARSLGNQPSIGDRRDDTLNSEDRSERKVVDDGNGDRSELVEAVRPPVVEQHSPGGDGGSLAGSTSLGGSGAEVAADSIRDTDSANDDGAIRQEFTVDAPVAAVWDHLTDAYRVANCLPGATITDRVDERTYKATISVTYGPVPVCFTGTMRFERMNADERVIEITASGKLLGGVGRGQMRLISRLIAVADERTEVRVNSQVSVTGFLSHFGRGAIREIADRMMQHFADSIREELDGHSPSSTHHGHD